VFAKLAGGGGGHLSIRFVKHCIYLRALNYIFIKTSISFPFAISLSSQDK
jgi:hypothetical protein